VTDQERPIEARPSPPPWWSVTGVHHTAAHLGTAADAALASGFAPAVLRISALPHFSEGAYTATHQPHFGGLWQLEGRLITFFAIPGTPLRCEDPCQPAGVELDVGTLETRECREEGIAVSIGT